MSLDFDLANIKDKDTLCYQQVDGECQYSSLTYSLIWTMIPIAVSSITRENVEKVFQRIYAYEHLRGAMRQANGKPVYFTFEEVKAHIGLTTNVTNQTDAQVKKNWIDSAWRDLTWDARKLIEQAKVAEE